MVPTTEHEEEGAKGLDGEAGEDQQQEEEEERRKGTWKHAAFHVATTIATPAAYAPLPFALASLGWPLGRSFIHYHYSTLCFSFLLTNVYALITLTCIFFC